jgi:hypothetical protein
LSDSIRKIDGDILPLDARTSAPALDELAKAKRIIRYTTSDHGNVIQIVNFLRYQHPHPREKPSVFATPGQANGSGPTSGEPASRPGPSVIDPERVTDPVTADLRSGRNRIKPGLPDDQKQRRRVAPDGRAKRATSAPVPDDLVKKYFG